MCARKHSWMKNRKSLWFNGSYWPWITLALNHEVNHFGLLSGRLKMDVMSHLTHCSLSCVALCLRVWTDTQKLGCAAMTGGSAEEPFHIVKKIWARTTKHLKTFFFFLSLCFGLLSKMQSPSGEFHYRVMISRNSVLDFWKSKWVITFSKHLIEQYGFPVRVLLPPVGLAWS